MFVYIRFFLKTLTLISFSAVMLTKPWAKKQFKTKSSTTFPMVVMQSHPAKILCCLSSIAYSIDGDPTDVQKGRSQMHEKCNGTFRVACSCRHV